MFTKYTWALPTKRVAQASSKQAVLGAHTHFPIPLTAESGVLYVYFYCVIYFSSCSSRVSCAKGKWVSFLSDSVVDPYSLPK